MNCEYWILALTLSISRAQLKESDIKYKCTWYHRYVQLLR